MLEFVKQNVPAGRCPLAGNTIHMDKRFLDKYMPRLMQHLHYRIVDVSSVKELCRYVCTYMVVCEEYIIPKLFYSFPIHAQFNTFNKLVMAWVQMTLFHAGGGIQQCFLKLQRNN